MFKTKAILFVCALVLLVGAIATIVHADGEYVIVAMIQHNNGYLCRHMPQAEWDALNANHNLPAGIYYNVATTLQQLNDLHIWGHHDTLQEVQQIFQQNQLSAWPCEYHPPAIN